MSFSNLVNYRLAFFIDTVLSSYGDDEKLGKWIKVKEKFIEELSLSENTKFYDDKEFCRCFEIVLTLKGVSIIHVSKKISIKIDSDIPIYVEDISTDKEMKDLYKKLNMYLSTLFNSFDDKMIDSDIEFTDNHSITFDTQVQQFTLTEDN